jgi:hypothetical protein
MRGRVLREGTLGLHTVDTVSGEFSGGNAW